MRFLLGFLFGLLVRPIFRILGVFIVLALVSGIVLNAGHTTANTPHGDNAQIVRAVDGDTVIAQTGGRQERVRVLGIDTPETVKPNTAVQRCGPEASARAKSWVRTHPNVTLTRDPAAPNRDRYHRLLRYVQPTDGTRDLSTVQVAAGLARIATYGQHLTKLQDLRRAQTHAKNTHRGLWGTTCAH
jgi:micrococcal nuclease